MANLKVVEISAYSKTEALKQVPFNTAIKGADCTQAWKNAGKPTEKEELKEFMLKQLDDKTKNTEGYGCYIVTEAGSPNLRERPYTYNDVVNEQGKRKYKKAIMLINPTTNEILDTVSDSKGAAAKAAKDIYVNGYVGDIVAKYVHVVEEGEALAFTMSYTPSKSAKLGKYLAFGMVEEF